MVWVGAHAHPLNQAKQPCALGWSSSRLVHSRRPCHLWCSFFSLSFSSSAFWRCCLDWYLLILLLGACCELHDGSMGVSCLARRAPLHPQWLEKVHTSCRREEVRCPCHFSLLMSSCSLLLQLSSGAPLSLFLVSLPLSSWANCTMGLDA